MTPLVRAVLEDHQIGQERYALSEAIFAVTNYLLIFHVHLHSSYEDLLCDLVEHQGETDQPVGRWVFLFLSF